MDIWIKSKTSAFMRKRHALKRAVSCGSHIKELFVEPCTWTITFQSRKVIGLMMHNKKRTAWVTLYPKLYKFILQFDQSRLAKKYFLRLYHPTQLHISGFSNESLLAVCHDKKILMPCDALPGLPTWQHLMTSRKVLKVVCITWSMQRCFWNCFAKLLQNINSTTLTTSMFFTFLRGMNKSTVFGTFSVKRRVESVTITCLKDNAPFDSRAQVS